MNSDLPIADPGHLRRTQVGLAMQAGLSVAVGVLLVGLLTYIVAISRLDADLEARLEQAALHGTVADPPPGVWLVQLDGSRRLATADAPQELPTPAQVAASTVRPWVEEVHLGEAIEYLTWTGAKNGRVVAAGIPYQERG
jgi:hypothetical protein